MVKIYANAYVTYLDKLDKINNKLGYLEYSKISHLLPLCLNFIPANLLPVDK